MSRAPLLLALLLALAPPPALARSSLPPDALASLAFTPHPGSRLPLATPLVDEDGKPVRLGQFFGDKPAVLVLDYLTCKTLCGATLGNLARALDTLPEDAGRDFAVVVVSIDPRDTPEAAREAKARDLGPYRHAGAARGWHFLTGPASATRAVADAVGFPYRYDAAIDQYAHPAGIVVAAPDGTIARYLLGVDYAPLALRLALAESGKGRVIATVSHLLLLCYGYDPQPGRYTPLIETTLVALNLGGALAFAALMTVIYRKRRS
jgi:protein SCO1/2